MLYSCETRADLVVKYRDLFQPWREIGLKTVFLGIEKVDDRGLESVRKRTKGGANTNLEAIEILRSHRITPMTSLITDPAWGEEDFDRPEEFVRLARLPCPTFTVLTPLPGTELWEASKPQITTDDYNLFDVMHLVLPSRLPPERGPAAAISSFAGGVTVTTRPVQRDAPRGVGESRTGDRPWGPS